MADTSPLRDIARRVSNWGRWGADDERGTVNFITPDVVQRAAALRAARRRLQPGARLGADGPQFGQAGRVNPLHIMTSTQQPDDAGSRRPPLRRRRHRHAAPVRDAVGQPRARPLRRAALQRASRRDRHVGRRRANGIDKMAAGIVSRGVLLDVARAARRRALGPGTSDHARRSRSGRARAGRARRARRRAARAHRATCASFTVYGDRVYYMKQMPGLGVACVEWLHAREVAAVATRHQHGRGLAARGSGGAVPAARALHPRHGPHARRDVRPRGARRRLRAGRRLGVPVHGAAAARRRAASARRSIPSR